ncbi:unnamed protein product [Moneuplotes crassus]|uniref:DNA repair protein RAD51 homolog 3 n=1 Tax=Euplotes crassus TaxID=5936 RepID=A0AAD2CYE6_EUPCR|nr:unnamed protein product [Moneuplotes crassus]
MEEISVTNLNVDKKVKSSLQASGVTTLADIEEVNFDKLYEEIPPAEIVKIPEILNDVKGISDHFKNLLQKQPVIAKRKTRQAINLIRLPDQDPDELEEDPFLDAVFGLGEVTEIVGPSGCGKGQIGYQLCLNVQTPKELGGIEGEALYFDANGDFSAERLQEMAKYYRKKLIKSLGKDKELGEKLKEEYTEEEILNRVYYFRILDEDDQIQSFFMLEKILETHKNIKLVYYDPITIHPSKNEKPYQERKRMVNNMLVHFLKLAKKFQVCFVLTNILKSVRKYGKEQSENITRLEPNFGEILFQSCTNRVHIDRDSRIGEDVFKATLTKGSIYYERTKEFQTHFQVKESGIASILS